MGKKEIRNNFRNSVFERDNWTCQVCGEGPYKSLDFFDAQLFLVNSRQVNLWLVI